MRITKKKDIRVYDSKYPLLGYHVAFKLCTVGVRQKPHISTNGTLLTAHVHVYAVTSFFFLVVVTTTTLFFAMSYSTTKWHFKH